MASAEAAHDPAAPASTPDESGADAIAPGARVSANASAERSAPAGGVQRPPLDAATRRGLPWLVAVAFFMQSLDATILNTALPSMARDLGESPLRMQSVVIAYLLTVALCIPASGWLADRFGTRRVFLFAIAAFGAGSLLCAVSPSLSALVAARVAQGIGGALLLPVGRLAVLRSFPRGELLRVMSFITLPGLVGPLIGPPLGGWLVEAASWHWVFLVNLPVGALGLFAAMRWMPDARGASVRRFDGFGFLLFAAGLAAATLGLQGLGEQAIGKAAAMLLLFAGLAAMTGYWLHAARVEQPLFGLSLFRIPTFSIGIAGNLFSRLGSGAMPFLTPLFLQLALGYPPTKAGLSMVPIVLGAMFCKTFAAPLIRRLGYRVTLVSNTLALGCLIAAFSLVDRETPHAPILALLVVFGIVNSLQFTAMNTLTLGDLDDAHASAGNSLLSVVMQISMSLGVAAASALLAAFNGGASVAAGGPRIVHAFHATYLGVGALSVLAACIFFQLGRREAPASKPAVVDEG